MIEIEVQARERAEKLEENQTLGVYDNDEDLARDMSFNDGKVSGYKEGFIDGAIWGYDRALNELVERVEKDQSERQVQTINVLELKTIIKEMGVDL